MSLTRPSGRELRRRLSELGCREESVPIFPGPDNEDGPSIRRIVNSRNEKSLPARDPIETQAAWLARITPNLAEPQQAAVAEALRLHQRYRFDPAGLGEADRQRLRDLCATAPAAR